MITRRHFLNLSAAASAIAMFPSGGNALAASSETRNLPNPLLSGSKKKGLGLGSRNPHWPGLLTELRLKWAYTWTGNVPDDLPVGMTFIPMVRSKSMETDQIASIAEGAKAQGITDLLGLNEPDAASQDDMTVEAALEAWPLLMATGLRLGSPACIHPDKEWMTRFMAGVKERKLRVDFVCVHSYGGPNAQALVNRLQKIHKMYGRPIWITEFGVGDWNAKSVEENRYKPETVLRFMEQVLPMFDKQDFIERYAWFPAPLDSIPLATSALFDADGQLTKLGQCYREA